MKNSQKGFSSIYGLVIVFIVAIIGGAFLYFFPKMTCACRGGADAAIKSILYSAYLESKTYASTTGSYAGYCTAQKSTTTANIPTFKNALIKNGSGQVLCNDSKTEWAMSAQLKQNKSIYYCVDSNDKRGTSTYGIGTGTKCP